MIGITVKKSSNGAAFFLFLKLYQIENTYIEYKGASFPIRPSSYIRIIYISFLWVLAYVMKDDALFSSQPINNAFA